MGNIADKLKVMGYSTEEFNGNTIGIKDTSVIILNKDGVVVYRGCKEKYDKVPIERKDCYAKVNMPHENVYISEYKDYIIKACGAYVENYRYIVNVEVRKRTIRIIDKDTGTDNLYDLNILYPEYSSSGVGVNYIYDVNIHYKEHVAALTWVSQGKYNRLTVRLDRREILCNKKLDLYDDYIYNDGIYLSYKEFNEIEEPARTRSSRNMISIW